MRIKKVAQSLLKGLIFNEKKESSNDTYSCDYLNREFGKIVETGLGENGSDFYVKYDCGFMITNHQVTISAKRNVEWGSMYESAPLQLGNFPAEFKYTPFIYLMSYGKSTILQSAQLATPTYAGQTYICAPTKSDVEESYIIQVLAMGYWK